jgi:hypothetical protein
MSLAHSAARRLFRFDAAHRFLPDGLTRVHELGFLTDAERRHLGQIQSRA